MGDKITELKEIEFQQEKEVTEVLSIILEEECLQTPIWDLKIIMTIYLRIFTEIKLKLINSLKIKANAAVLLEYNIIRRTIEEAAS